MFEITTFVYLCKYIWWMYASHIFPYQSKNPLRNSLEFLLQKMHCEESGRKI